jgi:heptosyltransferase III
MRRLLIRPGAIGDCILALPGLESHRADYTEVWAPRAILPLIQFADRTRAIADTGLDLVGVIEDARIRGLESFDSIYSWYGYNHSEFREAVRDLPFTFFPALPIHVTGVPRVRVPVAAVENFAVVHPFSGGAKKNWALDSYRDLAARLEMPVRYCAGPHDLLDDAVRIENLFELGCWLSTASVYVGNDSGISHLAAAVGVPTIAIFLSTDPMIWAPRGEHVVVLQNPSVARVVDAVRMVRR